MSKIFLFDTNALSAFTQEYAKNYDVMTSKVKALDSNDVVCVSILSLYEMEYGVSHSTNPEIAFKTKLTIEMIKDEKDIQVLPLTTNGATIFGEIKEQYRKEKGIGKKALQKHNLDLIIAATAIEARATLVSQDNKDKIFEILQRVRNDFKWEDWTQ